MEAALGSNKSIINQIRALLWSLRPPGRHEQVSMAHPVDVDFHDLLRSTRLSCMTSTLQDQLHVFSGSNFSPEKSLQKNRSIFLSRKSVLRPALQC